MRKFETLLLLSPELSAETREGILTALTGVVERENGVMEEVDHWGMRDLAYPVRKQMRGYYVRLVYQAPPNWWPNWNATCASPTASSSS